MDEGWRGFDDVGVQPEDPGSAWAEGGEDEAVAGAGHGLAAGFLVGKFVALFFVLRLERRVEVLPEDGDACEAVGHCARLGLADGLFERCHRGVAFFRVWYYEPQRDELVWVCKFLDIVPVPLVEAGEGGENEDALALARCVAAGREAVEVVLDDRGRRLAAIFVDWLRDKGFRRRRERVFCCVFEP